ncbi:hypothetical protein ERJ75_000237200 [Trypanosoma vivax]|uniref:Uncharacterized protein n=1 Tax=Trypanosoma vivax (strain Y486) TaxID=1055687 RepID=G0TY79_TRYVY|nr:hypothetical protein TRVL_04991 [Trypanosoma vivax]KAH8618842.1 hypothetical protein ERJ75_000237200 [Trypanosoma vivax]CCC48924.1 conserved hypothetical protein [Trypanosoma vivax Y486]
MYRRTHVLPFFSKPITQGYTAQLPQSSLRRNVQWRRCFDANREVRKLYTPDAQRYEEWYKSTYEIDDLSDGCAASGAASNKKLDDTRNLSEITDVLELRAIEDDLELHSQQFSHSTLAR